MAGYFLPWLVVGVAAALSAGLLWLALRRWRRLRWLAAGLTMALALAPYRFDGEHWAPAFVVSLFRLLFEDDVSPRGPLLILGAATALVLALAAAGIGVVALAQLVARPRVYDRSLVRRAFR